MHGAGRADPVSRIELTSCAEDAPTKKKKNTSWTYPNIESGRRRSPGLTAKPARCSKSGFLLDEVEAEEEKKDEEEDGGAELANVEGGTLTGRWPRRVKPPGRTNESSKERVCPRPSPRSMSLRSAPHVARGAGERPPGSPGRPGMDQSSRPRSSESSSGTSGVLYVEVAFISGDQSAGTDARGFADVIGGIVERLYYVD